MLIGYDSDRCALLAVVDPVDLDPTEELLALMAGRRTYTLDSTGRLNRRGPRQIRAGQPYRTVTQHECEWAIPGSPFPIAKRRQTRSPDQSPLELTPPF